MSEKKRLTLPHVLTLAFAWLIPGGGFMLYGRFWRGFVLFAIILLTFLIGCALYGGVVWPVWSFRGDGFNIINNITFLIQMGSGLPALLSLASELHPEIGLLRWAAPDPSHALFDLGSFYLLVCGAMNYFVIGNVHDRIFRHRHGKQEVEASIQ